MLEQRRLARLVERLGDKLDRRKSMGEVGEITIPASTSVLVCCAASAPDQEAAPGAARFKSSNFLSTGTPRAYRVPVRASAAPGGYLEHRQHRAMTEAA